jgi:hypothetical protein
MSIQFTLVLPDSLKKPVLELEKELDRIDPPKTRGAPRKVSNRDLAARLVFQAFKGASWRSWGDGHDTYRKRFLKLSKDKSFELFFLQLYPKAKVLWEN